MERYVDRAADRRVSDLLDQLPAVELVGPRATGKTTTAARLAAAIVRLDRPAEAAAFAADPDAALRGLAEPVLLDEWQEVPGVLGAVKRAVDEDPHPGRYLLTGSVRADLDVVRWPGTGRLVRVPMWGLTERELRGGLEQPPLLDLLAGGQGVETPDPPDLRGYVELALRGGFPEPALRLTGVARAAWLESYLDQLVTRDAQQLDEGRDPERLRRYLEALALSTAGVVQHTTLYQAAGINRRTAVAYDQLLVNLYVLEHLPAWGTNRLARLVDTPKRHLCDPALAAAALRVDVNGVLRDGDLLGRLLDSFVVAQVRGDLVRSTIRPRLLHLRTEQGRHEIDLIAELGGDRVVALEVKATAAPGRDDARNLRWLRDALGDRFTAGAVLHTGPRAFTLDERIVAAPIAALWG